MQHTRSRAAKKGIAAFFDDVDDVGKREMEPGTTAGTMAGLVDWSNDLLGRVGIATEPLTSFEDLAECASSMFVALTRRVVGPEALRGVTKLPNVDRVWNAELVVEALSSRLGRRVAATGEGVARGDAVHIARVLEAIEDVLASPPLSMGAPPPPSRRPAWIEDVVRGLGLSEEEDDPDAREGRLGHDDDDDDDDVLRGVAALTSTEEEEMQRQVLAGGGAHDEGDDDDDDEARALGLGLGLGGGAGGQDEEHGHAGEGVDDDDADLLDAAEGMVMGVGDNASLTSSRRSDALAASLGADSQGLREWYGGGSEEEGEYAFEARAAGAPRLGQMGGGVSAWDEETEADHIQVALLREFARLFPERSTSLERKLRAIRAFARHRTEHVDPQQVQLNAAREREKRRFAHAYASILDDERREAKMAAQRAALRTRLAERERVHAARVERVRMRRLAEDMAREAEARRVRRRAREDALVTNLLNEAFELEKARVHAATQRVLDEDRQAAAARVREFEAARQRAHDRLEMLQERLDDARARAKESSAHRRAAVRTMASELRARFDEAVGTARRQLDRQEEAVYEVNAQAVERAFAMLNDASVAALV